MKKIIAIMMILLVCGVMLTGCERKNESIVTTELDNRFMIIEDTNLTSFNRIIVDKDTKVMYLFHKSGYGGGMTVMVDTDGKPLIYEGE